jgi:hypothetical protein
MKATYFILVFTILITTGCGSCNKEWDKMNYTSITGRHGKVIAKIGETSFIYDNATIKYSNSDATTLHIITENGKEVYIQGPAIIELKPTTGDNLEDEISKRIRELRKR